MLRALPLKIKEIKMYYRKSNGQKSKVFTELPTDGFDHCVICGKKTTGYAFCKNCWSEHDEEELLDILNNKKTRRHSSKEIGEEDDFIKMLNDETDSSSFSEDKKKTKTTEKNNNELTCLICGKPSNGKHFCLECYNKFKDKTLYLKVNKCIDFEKLDAEYESDLVCDDGHLVKSPYEKIIDNYLYAEGIKHAYETKIDVDENHDITPDFYLPEHNGIKDIYIEFWGYGEENIKYQKIKEYKTKIYPQLIKERGITVIYLNKKQVDSNSFKKTIKYAKERTLNE